jgi:hypothetical protein
MAQTYTLDEAAHKLGISADDLKRRLRDEWKHIRAFRDGATLRFRANDIDELSRTLTEGSGDDLRLGRSSEQVTVPGKAAGDDPLVLSSDDVFVLSPEEKDKSKSSSGKIKAGKPDSDVRLEKKPGAKKPPADDESILTEEIQIDLPASSKSGKLGGKSGRLAGGSGKIAKGDSGKIAKSDSGKLAKGDSGKMAGQSGTKLPGQSGTRLPAVPQEDSSEFELSLQPTTESSDEFELALNDSDEVPLGDAPKPKSGSSGINLHRPSDSGPSLEKKKGKKDASTSDEEIDFELSLDSGASSMRLGPSGKRPPDSDSEFELTLDDSDPLATPVGDATAAADEPKGDIFETDFEIPALDDTSGSEAVNLEEADTDLESSDFDLALEEGDAASEDESGSQVVVIDEDEGTRPKHLVSPGKRRAPKEVDEGEVSYDDLEEGESASKALRGVRGEVEEEEEGERVVVAAGPATWPGWVSIPLLIGTFLIFLGGIMSYELLNGMWGYHQPTPPASYVVDGVANVLGAEPGK